MDRKTNWRLSTEAVLLAVIAGILLVVFAPTIWDRLGLDTAEWFVVLTLLWWAIALLVGFSKRTRSGKGD